MIRSAWFLNKKPWKRAVRPKVSPISGVKKLGVLGAGHMGAGHHACVRTGGIRGRVDRQTQEAAEREAYSASFFDKGIGRRNPRGKRNAPALDLSLATTDLDRLNRLRPDIEAYSRRPLPLKAEMDQNASSVIP